MTYEKGQNVFEGMPVSGTVITIVTEQELEAFKKVNHRYEAAQLAPTLFSRPEVGGYIQDHKKWWHDIFVKYDIPASWNISLDELTGAIYIS